MKILIVDDNAQNIYLARFLLEKRGHEIHEAGTAAEALAWLADNRPDAILMDLGLPDIDGLELTRRIHALPGLEDVPIIACTAHSMPGDRQNALDAGCIEYISKPIDPATFADTVEEAVA